jgi:hypothetical protein
MAAMWHSYMLFCLIDVVIKVIMLGMDWSLTTSIVHQYASAVSNCQD